MKNPTEIQFPIGSLVCTKTNTDEPLIVIAVILIDRGAGYVPTYEVTTRRYISGENKRVVAAFSWCELEPYVPDEDDDDEED
ncbi:MAG: hypothetical protein ACYSW8_27410 [Planctomycetota bacterium]|jgi:hypothetical protein